MLPRISFVVPILNSGDRLNRCLESITSTDYPRELIEIIVVDSGVRDDLARTARGHGAVVLRCRGRVAELRNRGARAAIGSILAFIDADDTIDRRSIHSVVDALSGHAAVSTGAPYLAIRRSHFDDLGGFDAAFEMREQVDSAA